MISQKKRHDDGSRGQIDARSQAKDRQPREAGEVEEQITPYSLSPGQHSPADLFGTSDLQIYKIIYLCCFKLKHLW